MTAPDPAKAIAELIGGRESFDQDRPLGLGVSSQMTPDPILKICGITRLVDALHAVQQGATALGFVFWTNSPQSDCSGGREGHHRGAAARGDDGRRVRERVAGDAPRRC